MTKASETQVGGDHAHKKRGGPKLRDLTGRRFGTLTVIRRIPKDHNLRWECICECGKTSYPRASRLLKGLTKGCGCLRVWYHTKHLKSKTTEWNIWALMRQRCSDIKSNSYKNYGGRGITVCDRWKNSFVDFLADMGPRPSRGHTLDRINNDGNYEPGNCRWATAQQQARNKRCSINIVYRGISGNIKEWAQRTGIPASTLAARNRKNLTGEE